MLFARRECNRGRDRRFEDSSPMRPGRLVHVLFYISVIGKGVDGALEVLGGALLAVVDPARIHGLVRTLTQRELDHAPHGVVGRYLLHTAEHLSPGPNRSRRSTYCGMAG